MKILITTDVVGGVWRYTVTLVRELVAQGHTCALAVLGDPDEERLRALPEEVEVHSLDVRLEWMPGGLEDTSRTTEWLVQLARDCRADIVHLNQLTYADGRYPAPIVVVAHSDVLSWYDEVKGAIPHQEWAGYKEAVNAGIDAADVVVAPTAYQSGRLARNYGRTAVRVIHNGIRHPERPPETPASERSLVLVAGRAWDDAKGIELLDNAVAELDHEAPTIHLVGPLRGPAGEEVHVEHMVLHGEVDGEVMGRFYQNTKLYVGPSLYEPFGLSPLEAAGHGCALLLSGIGSFRELWTDAAEFFEPLHPDVLARRLQAVLRHTEGLDQQAELALERARGRYTSERMAGDYVRLYEELIPAGPAVAYSARESPLADE